ncbi:insulinase family protein [Lysobacter pythonis]|uniref:Insulinase family protein n=1 Tax=Solilutibacter pythonis TaxID=2483112 RepID=A0A3M2I4K4_9GAMM|nr:pitrilysin family protein [Lysobacter pythonis]RMH93154.1 insulinase family protein [Lysobacter pythonis]
MSRLRTLSLACALALAPTARAAADAPRLPQGVSAASCVEGICEYGLANGLRVLLFPDASKPTVTVNVTYAVGSMHENYGETGMAHLLEHMVFKGTPRHGDIPAEMKRRGISFNGTTSLDRTNYFGSFPANDDTLDWLLAMEADRMVNAFIARKDLDSEMTVVRNEMERGENKPGRVLTQRLRAAAFQWHNYGKSTIGNRADVENVPIEHLQAFYRRWYQPDNATLIVAGRFDPAKVLTKVRDTFGQLKRPARQLPTLWTLEPTQDGEREITVRRSGDLRLIGLAYHVPAAAHPDTPALLVLANILGHTPGGRLHKSLVETRLAASAFAGTGARREPDTFTLIAVPPNEHDPAKAEAELLKQAERIADTPITAQELADARQRIANGYELAFNDVNRIGLAMSEYVAAGDWRLYFVLRDAMEKVTLEDVNRVATKYLIATNRTLARFVPTDNAVRAEITKAPALAPLVAGYTGREAVAAGEVFDTGIGNIAARTEILTLGEGLKVSLLPKKNRGQTVVVDADFRFGDVATLKRHPVAAAGMVGAMLMRGSQALNREEIDKRFEALKTAANVNGGMQGASIGLATRRGELAEALTLAADILKRPSFPASEFEQLRLQAITAIEASRKDPNTAIAQAAGPHFDPWPKDHPLRFRDLDQSLADLRALELDDLRAFHRDVYGSAAGEIAIVGDFDPATVKPLLQKLFADWRPGTPYRPIDTRHHPVAPERRRLETPDKSNAVYMARMNLPLNDNHPDYPALLVANHVFGGGGLSSRLSDRARQKDGLSYGIGSAISADSSQSGRDDAGSFSIQGIAAPQNMAKLEAAVREELERFVREGITGKELADAVNGMLTQRAQSRASDRNLAALLNADQYLGRRMRRRAEFEAKLKSLSVAQVNAAIARHLEPTRMSVYMAGDFARAEAGE